MQIKIDCYFPRPSLVREVGAELRGTVGCEVRGSDLSMFHWFSQNDHCC